VKRLHKYIVNRTNLFGVAVIVNFFFLGLCALTTCDVLQLKQQVNIKCT